MFGQLSPINDVENSVVFSLSNFLSNMLYYYYYYYAV